MRADRVLNEKFSTRKMEAFFNEPSGGLRDSPECKFQLTCQLINGFFSARKGRAGEKNYLHLPNPIKAESPGPGTPPIIS